MLCVTVSMIITARGVRLICALVGAHTEALDAAIDISINSPQSRYRMALHRAVAEQILQGASYEQARLDGELEL